MMKSTTIRLLMLIFLITAAHQYQSCKKIDLKREILISTGQAQGVDFRSAFLYGSIVDRGEEGSFTEYGFVYSTAGSPTVNDEKVAAGFNWQLGVYSYQIEGLESNTTYYFKAYAMGSGEPVYGNVSSFKTELNPNVSPPTVGTLQVLEITQISARIRGVVTDDGGADVIRKGFCISTQPDPNVDEDQFSENGSGEGEFTHTFNNLSPNTTYFVKAYAQNQVGISYGGQIEFVTEEGGGIVSEWLHYDDGVNFDGIGLTEGGSFDVAMRFTPQQLAAYNGFKVTRFRIFVRESYPVEYYLEIFKGAQPTLDDLMYDQLVEAPSANQWNDIPLDEPYIIDASDELWFGYYVTNQEPGTYPAGIDDGPAETGFGDLISASVPLAWGTLADAEIDANWNIQVFVTNESGEEIPMVRTRPHPPARQAEMSPASGIQSSKKMSN